MDQQEYESLQSRRTVLERELAVVESRIEEGKMTLQGLLAKAEEEYGVSTHKELLALQARIDADFELMAAAAHEVMKYLEETAK